MISEVENIKKGLVVSTSDFDNNKNYNKINDYQNVEKYIKENCAYGCRYFILEKINEK